MSMFHHPLCSHYNSRKLYLNKGKIVPQNGNFLKNLFNRKYAKFNINIMSELVSVNIRPKTGENTFNVAN